MENPYDGLRAQILALVDETGMPFLRGAAFELGVVGGSATVVCVADGTTSIYFSGGGGRIGCGAHESVRRAAEAYLALVHAHRQLLTKAAAVPPPGPEQAQFVAVTGDGLFVLSVPEASLREGTPPWQLYAAGHEVITRIRELEDSAVT